MRLIGGLAILCAAVPATGLQRAPTAAPSHLGSRRLRISLSKHGGDEEYWTLLRAVREKDWGALDRLLSEGADLESRESRSNMTVLWTLAVGDHDWAGVQELRRRGANLEAVNVQGLTALWFLAVFKKEWASVDELLSQGASIDAKDERSGRTALWYLAVYKQDWASVDQLLSRGASIDAKDSDGGRTALWHLAVNKQDWSSVDELQDRGADLESTDKWGRTPQEGLLMAQTVPESVYELQARGAGFGMSEKTAVEKCDFLSTIELRRVVDWSWLWRQGVDVDCKCGDGSTLVGMAAKKGLWPMLSQLVIYGADMDARQIDDRTAMQIAHAEGNDKAVDELESRGAAEPVNLRLFTALSYFAMSQNMEALRLYSVRKVDWNVRNMAGETVFMRAIQNKKWDAAVYLLSVGANIDAIDAAGRSATLRAVVDEDPIAVHKLQEWGANVYKPMRDLLDQATKLATVSQVVGVSVPVLVLLSAWAGGRARDAWRSWRRARRQRRISRRLRHLRSAHQDKHAFHFIRASKLREWTGGHLPHHQELLKWDGWLTLQEIDMRRGFQGKYAKSHLVLSHRWLTPRHPDPQGVKVGLLRELLVDGPEVEFVWVDFFCLPQGLPDAPRSEDEDVVFQGGLSNLWMLLLSLRILVAFDLQYAGRFWTSYEFWLALRTVSCNGLEPTSDEQRRMSIRCIGASKEAEDIHANWMFVTWAEKCAEAAADILANDDVLVTNQKDKDEQLNVLRTLAKEAPAIYQRAMSQQDASTCAAAGLGDRVVEVEMTGS